MAISLLSIKKPFLILCKKHACVGVSQEIDWMRKKIYNNKKSLIFIQQIHLEDAVNQVEKQRC